MVYFPVPTNAPPAPVAHIVRGPAKTAVKPTAPVGAPKIFTPPPEELRKLTEKTSSHIPPPDDIATEIPSLPNMAEMAKNVLKSLGRVVKSAAKGDGIRLGKEAAEARLAICRACPFFRSTDERCSKCGCYMAVKTYLRAERCPIGKW